MTTTDADTPPRALRVRHQHTFTSTDGDIGLTIAPDSLRVWLDDMTILHTTKAYRLGELAAHLLGLRDILNDPAATVLLIALVNDESLP